MISALTTNLRSFLILFILATLLFLLDLFSLLNLPKSLVQEVTIPIQFGLYQTGKNIARQFEFITLARYSAKLHQAQTEQLAQILSENANLRRKLAETEGMLAQQNTLSPQTYNMVPARPIGISRYLLIDKGSNQGIKKDQAVVYKDNFIGKVIEVSPKMSKVILPSDPDSIVSAFSQNNDGKARGILRGNFGSEMLLDSVLHQEPLTVSDLVYTEGIETSLPRGLIIGTISEILDRENEVTKQAKVKPVFDIANLDILFVITD